MVTRKMTAMIGLCVGLAGGAVLLKRARDSTATAEMKTGEVGTHTDSAREWSEERVVEEAVRSIAAVVPENTNIYTDYGSDALVTGGMDDADLGLTTRPSIVVNGSSARRSIITAVPSETLEGASDEIVERLDGLKKRSYARVLLVGVEDTGTANRIASDADGVVTVATPESVGEFIAAN